MAGLGCVDAFVYRLERGPTQPRSSSVLLGGVMSVHTGSEGCLECGLFVVAAEHVPIVVLLCGGAWELILLEFVPAVKIWCWLGEGRSYWCDPAVNWQPIPKDTDLLVPGARSPW